MKQLSLAVTACLAAAGAANAFEFTNNSGGKVVFYGQVSPTILSFDDGFETNTELADNAASNTRLGFYIDQPWGAGTLRFRAEAALGLPASSDYSQAGDSPDWDWDRQDIRKFELSYSGDFGTIWVGQGSMASDGIAVDFSGTGMTSGPASAGDTAGSFEFRNDLTGELSGIEIGNVFNDFEGSRRMRIRYDTPSFEGFSVAVAYGVNALNSDDDDDYYDVALRYANEFGDFEVEGALGYGWRDRDEGGTEESWAGSVGFLHTPTGINGALSLGGEKDGGEFVYVKGGWVTELVSIGTTAFAVDYYDGSDFVTDGSDSTNFGVHVTQKWDEYGIEGYFGFRWYEFEDDSGIDYADANSILAGIRWRF